MVFGGNVIALLIIGNIPLLKISTILFAALFIVFCLVSFATKTETKEMIFSTLMVLIAFLLILGCEVVYLRDLFAGSLYRMNTLFKFYYQAWILFSIASGPFPEMACGEFLALLGVLEKGHLAELWPFCAFLGAVMYPRFGFYGSYEGKRRRMWPSWTGPFIMRILFPRITRRRSG